MSTALVLRTLKLRLPGTEIQHQRQKPRQGDSKKNHGRMDNIRQAPRHRQGHIRTCLKRQVYNSCVLPTHPANTGVRILRASHFPTPMFMLCHYLEHLVSNCHISFGKTLSCRPKNLGVKEVGFVCH
ncbi:hypothetical protein NP493_134g04043 [Ridgeia piscesae]|uniref:Uncharacterized protein n=1 Tax=Ridgeia piscesae TaxID=27915 RepID=A0AAD9P582_RIDPI|nr:hypothetical protein NP493_134g04043 [Ridgeia piscesae]